MRAAVFHPETGITVGPVPEPTLQPGEALIAIEACGVCGSDKQVVAGEPAPKGTVFPVILGHEIAGRIVALGDPLDLPTPEGKPATVHDTRDQRDAPADWTSHGHITSVRFTIGDEVLVFPFIPCGTCLQCERGSENLCTHQILVGYHRPGGYAERIVVPTKVLLKRPPGIPAAAAALLVDAFATPFHALSNHGGIQDTDYVIVIGTGGTGLAGLMLAKAMGSRAVGAVTRRDSASDAAMDAGADMVWIHRDERRVAREIRRWSEGGADIVLDTVGSRESVEFGLSFVRPGGRLCVIGMGPGEASVPIAKAVRLAVTIAGSFGSAKGDVEQLIALTENGRLNPGRLVGGTFPLQQIKQAFLPNTRSGRAVIVPGQA